MFRVRVREKCYQIDDFISPFFDEKEVTRLYDANLEPIYKIIKYGDFSRRIKLQTRIKLNDNFFQKPPLFKYKFWKGKIYNDKKD